MYYLLLLGIVLIIAVFYLRTWLILYNYTNLSPLSRAELHDFNLSVYYNHRFPPIVHQMWKGGKSLPTNEMTRWRSGCKSLNPQINFKLYDDDDLKKFVHENFPRYSMLFDSLKGVYMADMARILVAYYYGGIYMDLDFYCYKPMSCLESYMLNKALPKAVLERRKLGENIDVYNISNILVVPREPLVHARLAHHVSRVVIQDFYMTTPRHPFLLWLLEYYNYDFHYNLHHELNSMKGPFSYSIHKDINRFYQEIGIDLFNVSNKPNDFVKSKDFIDLPTLNKSTFNYVEEAKKMVIIELDEQVLHPLLDSTNSKLFSSCPSNLHKNSCYRTGEHKTWVKLDKIRSENVECSVEEVDKAETAESCGVINRKKFFRPTEDTFLVHMWTHVYLGWNFLRGAYNSQSYNEVEKKLKPTFTC